MNGLEAFLFWSAQNMYKKVVKNGRIWIKFQLAVQLGSLIEKILFELMVLIEKKIGELIKN